MVLRFLRRGLVLLVGACFVSPALAAGPAPSQPTSGSGAKVYEKEYGSWTYRCDTLATGGLQTAQCQVFQNMGVKNKNQTIPISLLIFTKAVGQASYDVSAIVPLGVLLASGVSISADEMPPAVKTIDFCRINGCMVSGQPAAGLVEELQRGRSGHLVFVRGDGRPFTVSFSLDGFSEAVAALNSGELPPEVKQ